MFLIVGNCDQELLGQDTKNVPEDENVEAICQFFNTIGKQLDESQKSKRINDMYFSRLKDLSTNPQLAARLRFMVRNVIDLRTNNWVPRREEVTLTAYDFVFHTYLFLKLIMLYFLFWLPGES